GALVADERARGRAGHAAAGAAGLVPVAEEPVAAVGAIGLHRIRRAVGGHAVTRFGDVADAGGAAAHGAVRHLVVSRTGDVRCPRAALGDVARAGRRPADGARRR